MTYSVGRGPESWVIERRRGTGRMLLRSGPDEFERCLLRLEEAMKEEKVVCEWLEALSYQLNFERDGSLSFKERLTTFMSVTRKRYKVNRCVIKRM